MATITITSLLLRRSELSIHARIGIWPDQTYPCLVVKPPNTVIDRGLLKSALQPAPSGKFKFVVSRNGVCFGLRVKGVFLPLGVMSIAISLSDTRNWCDAANEKMGWYKVRARS